MTPPQTQPMIERIARVLASSMGDGLPWTDWTGEAVAILQAMRTPTPGMVEAGFMARDRAMNLGENTAATWIAMIDTALNEREG